MVEHTMYSPIVENEQNASASSSSKVQKNITIYIECVYFLSGGISNVIHFIAC